MAGAVALAGCDRATGAGGGPRGFGRGYADVTGRGPDGQGCTALPPETNGPFPADGTNGRGGTISVLDQAGIERVDIRTSFAGLTGTAAGVPLDLEIALVDVDRGCAPLAGRALYIWHCDAAGRYSLYYLPEQNYLRGLQVTDAAGRARFRTIFPACYPGRFPHIHFEVFAGRAKAASGRDSLLTSQFALPAEADQAVYQTVPAYRASLRQLAEVSLEGDGVFGDNSAAQRTAQTLALTGDPQAGYRARGAVGLTARYA